MPTAKKATTKNPEDRTKPCNKLEMIFNPPQKAKRILSLLSHTYFLPTVTSEWCLPLKCFYLRHRIYTPNCFPDSLGCII